jgi:hypothetical protein
MHGLPQHGELIEPTGGGAQHPPHLRTGHAANSVATIGERDGSILSKIDNDLAATDESMNVPREVVLWVDTKPDFSYPNRPHEKNT